MHSKATPSDHSRDQYTHAVSPRYKEIALFESSLRSKFSTAPTAAQGGTIHRFQRHAKRKAAARTLHFANVNAAISRRTTPVIIAPSVGATPALLLPSGTQTGAAASKNAAPARPRAQPV